MEDNKLKITFSTGNEAKNPFTSQSDRISAYIFTKKTFSYAELRKNFPSVPLGSISSAINKLLRFHRIVRTAQGEYKVISTEELPISQAQQIRNYILSCQTFCTKDIRENFPTFARQYIFQALNKLLDAQLITRTGYGQYKVNSSEDVNES